MTNPDLTIAALDVRPRGYPRECLAALARAPESQRAELLFISTADRAADAPIEQFAPAFAATRAFHVKDGADPAAAKNLALTEARAEQVLLVSSAAVIAPDCLARLREALAARPRAAVAAALLMRENGWPRQSWLSAPSLRAQFGRPINFLRAWDPRGSRYGGLRWERRPLRRVAAAPAACALFRKGAWSKTGPFTADYCFDLDDVEWGCRARRHGLEIIIASAARAFFIPPQEGGGIPFAARLAYEHSLRNCVRALHGPAYARTFDALRFLRSARLALCAGAISLLTARRSDLMRWTTSVHWRLLRWHLAGHVETGSPGEAESNRRWERLLC